jgi:hypothetical protein
MITIRFELDHDLAPAAPVKLNERRGEAVIKLSPSLFPHARAAEIGIPALNREVQRLVDGCRWFQLWQGDIVTQTPDPDQAYTGSRPAGARTESIPAADQPLSSRYFLADLPDDAPVKLVEDEGQADFLLSRTLFTDRCAHALSTLAEQVLSGGQWFQVWDDHVITMYPHTRDNGGAASARLHRGSLVHKTP